MATQNGASPRQDTEVSCPPAPSSPWSPALLCPLNYPGLPQHPGLLMPRLGAPHASSPVDGQTSCASGPGLPPPNPLILGLSCSPVQSSYGTGWLSALEIPEEPEKELNGLMCTRGPGSTPAPHGPPSTELGVDPVICWCGTPKKNTGEWKELRPWVWKNRPDTDSIFFFSVIVVATAQVMPRAAQESPAGG